MAPSAPRRDLTSEGIPFRQIADEVRQTRVCELLAERLKVEEIAERLGYAETSSFVYAFKRWTGKPPGAYRREPEP